MQQGQVDSYQEFYEFVQNERGALVSCRVAQLRQTLKAIEESEKAKHCELPPLVPMLDTLR